MTALVNFVLGTKASRDEGVIGSEFPHVMLPTLTSRSRRPSSRPPPVSAGRWPASPEHGPAPPPPAGSCGSKTPPRPRPAGARRVREGDEGIGGVKDQVTVRKRTADTKGRTVSRMDFILANSSTKTSNLCVLESQFFCFHCLSGPT